MSPLTFRTRKAVFNIKPLDKWTAPSAVILLFLGKIKQEESATVIGKSILSDFIINYNPLICLQVNNKGR